MRADEIVATHAAGAVASIGHTTVDAHTFAFVRAVSFQVLTARIRRGGTGFNTASRFVQVFDDLIFTDHHNNRFRAVADGGDTVAVTIDVLDFTV